TGDGVTGATLAISSGAATGAADTADLVLYDSVAGNGYAGGAYISVDAPILPAGGLWASLGTPSGVTVTQARYRKLPNGCVIIQISVNVTTPVANFSFPNAMGAAYQPSVTIRQPMSQTSSAGAIARAIVTTGGTVQIFALSSTLSGQYDATFTYPVV
ncbi:MAG TPA: hypothetical protein VGG25_01445, partial [Streptosporangiaceae bacterium]